MVSMGKNPNFIVYDSLFWGSGICQLDMRQPNGQVHNGAASLGERAAPDVYVLTLRPTVSGDLFSGSLDWVRW